MIRGKRWVPFLVLLGLFVIFGLAACANGLGGKSGSQDQSNVGEGFSATTTYKYTCPLDGVPIQALPEVPPMAVVIDNHPNARPQSGLINADLVFETLAEGGVTRFLAIYYHGQASKIGPVRSARSYFIELASSVNSILVHAGGSPDALEYMRSQRFPHFNEFNFAEYFWREKGRRAPHNLYTSTEKLHSLAQKEGFNHPEQLVGYKFREQADDTEANASGTQEASVLTSDEISIDFPGQYDVSYTYVPKKNAYSRFIAGKAHNDEFTGNQLQPRNIIVKFVKTRVIDSQGRLKIDVSGHGRALIFTGGEVIEGVWQKDNPHGLSIFETLEGQAIELLPGQVWIEVVPESTEVTF